MKTVILLCYCVAFITTASSLTCQNCRATNEATCVGTNDQCDSSVTSCISSLVEIIHGTVGIKMPRKFCGIPEICNFSYSITLNDTHIASRIQCCTSDICNTNIPEIGPRNLTKNGLKCPYCVKPGLDGCTADYNMLCTGLENMCINYSGDMGFEDTPVDVSYQGCCTESLCPDTPESPQDMDNGMRLNCVKAAHHCSEEDDHHLPVIS